MAILKAAMFDGVKAMEVHGGCVPDMRLRVERVSRGGARAIAVPGREQCRAGLAWARRHQPLHLIVQHRGMVFFDGILGLL